MESEIYNLKYSNYKNNNNNLKIIILNLKKFFLILLYISIIYFLIYIFYLFKVFKKYENIIKINKIYKNTKITLYNQNEILKAQNNILLKLEDNKNNISNKLKLLKIISNNNELKYKGVENCLLNDPDSQYCIYHLIIPKKVIGKKRILIGAKRDGCYVLLDDFKDIKIAYSFGISKMIQFDKDLADRGIDVFMYDHTINSLPYNNPKFHWKKIGISGKNPKNNQLKSLEELIIENGHSLEKNMILKIDVEHSEWDSLKDISNNILNQFKYIAIEFHFISDKNENKLYYDVLKKLQTNHQVFYLRCHGRENIVIFGNNRICKNLEVSYIIKKDNIFSKDESIYPIFEFDFMGPKLEGKTEINLNILKLFDL